MRPIEALLILSNLLTFGALTVVPPRAVRWLRHSAPVALLIAVAQVLIEGARWQTIPAYVLTGRVAAERRESRLKGQSWS